MAENIFSVYLILETHQNVTRVSEKYSAKVSAKDLAVYLVASSF